MASFPSSKEAKISFFRPTNSLTDVSGPLRTFGNNLNKVGVYNQIAPRTFRVRQLAAKIALLIAAFIVLSLLCYYNFRKFPLSSEDASVFLEGYDIGKGNWDLRGWWIGEDNYLTTDAVFYAVLIRFFGFNPHIMFYLPAIFWAGLVLLSVELAWRGLVENKAVTVALLTPILFPVTWQS
jgi:hypothetical protein